MSRKTLLPIVVATCLSAAATSSSCASDDAAQAARSAELFARLQTNLQQQLAQAIAQGGPQSAIRVCASISPQLEQRLSHESGIAMRRISDRPRNPAHLADDYERAILDSWRADLAAGRAPRLHYQRRPEGLRIMSPIVIGNALCLRCHGGPADIDLATRRVIQASYPDDQATGYSMGQLRGAFSAIAD